MSLQQLMNVNWIARIEHTISLSLQYETIIDFSALEIMQRIDVEL